MKETTRVTERLCKSCFHVIDSHSAVENHKDPEKGDISICIYCGVISEFDDNMDIVAVSAEFLEELKETDYKAYTDLLKLAAIIKNQIAKN